MKRPIDFSFKASLSWPTDQWYEPTIALEVAQQAGIRSAREQGLPDQIEDVAVVSRLRALFGGHRA